jgi:hypothetical protein
MKPEIVFAAYRAHTGKDKELLRLLADHVPGLRKLDLVTDREPIVVQATDGTYIEIFEWRSGQAASVAHEHPAVAKIWEAIGSVSDFTSLDKLEETKKPFCHFAPVSFDS